MMYSETMLDTLREKVSSGMSEWRFRHTAEVEKMATRLGELYAPDKLDVLRAAALLHDVTKEKSSEEHFEIMKSYGVEISELDRISPKTLHAKTAALVIPDEFSDFADDEVISCVRWHTTGRADMTLTEALIYLADYIDESRKFDDCVFLRNYFWDKLPQNMSPEDRERHLWQTVLLSFDMTVRSLESEGAPISPETLDAREAVKSRLKK